MKQSVVDDSAEPASSRPRVNEALSVQDCSHLLVMVDCVSSEIFTAKYLKKKMSQELPYGRNLPDIQKLVDCR